MPVTICMDEVTYLIGTLLACQAPTISRDVPAVNRGAETTVIIIANLGTRRIRNQMTSIRRIAGTERDIVVEVDTKIIEIVPVEVSLIQAGIAARRSSAAIIADRDDTGMTRANVCESVAECRGGKRSAHQSKSDKQISRHVGASIPFRILPILLESVMNVLERFLVSHADRKIISGPAYDQQSFI